MKVGQPIVTKTVPSASLGTNTKMDAGAPGGEAHTLSRQVLPEQQLHRGKQARTCMVGNKQSCSNADKSCLNIGS